MASRVVFLTPGALSSHDLACWLLRHEDQPVLVGADDIAAVSLHSDGYIELEYSEWLELAGTEEGMYPTEDDMADARHFSLESDQIEAPTAFTRSDQVLEARLMMAKTDLQLDYEDREKFDKETPYCQRLMKEKGGDMDTAFLPVE